MSNKFILAALLILLGAAVIAGIVAMQSKKQKPEESSESSAAVVSEILVVPDSIPDRFSFEPPADFSETASKYYTKYYVLNDASIIVTGDKMTIYGETLEDYAKSVKSQYEQTADNFMLYSEEDVRVNGMDCKVYEFTYDIVGSDVKQTMECTTAVFVQGDEAFIMTCKSRMENYQAYRSAFRRAIETVKIADPGYVQTAPAETSLFFAETSEPPAETSELPAEKDGAEALE